MFLSTEVVTETCRAFGNPKVKFAFLGRFIRIRSKYSTKENAQSNFQSKDRKDVITKQRKTSNLFQEMQTTTYIYLHKNVFLVCGKGFMGIRSVLSSI